MTGLAHAGYCSLKALQRRDWKAYDRWFMKARKAADAIARDLRIATLCSACGDALCLPSPDPCRTCRAFGRVA